MKHLIFLVVFAAFMGLISPAQQRGVSVNTDGSLPHKSAILDVKSTVQGFLPPRMTSSQRMAIVDPENGLLVYDTDHQKWRFMIDNSYWAKSHSRKWMYNGLDSVGIGTANVLAKLHVNNGDFRLQNGNMNLVGGDINFEVPNGMIQFEDAGVKETFVQHSGDDLRMGTNAGNSNGKFIVRTDGANRISVNEKGLDMMQNATIVSNKTGDVNLLPLAYGRVGFTGGYWGTSNFTAQRIEEGKYVIDCPGFNSYTVIVITMNQWQGGMYANPIVQWLNDTKYQVTFYGTDGTKRDAGFSFIAYQPF